MYENVPKMIIETQYIYIYGKKCMKHVPKYQPDVCPVKSQVPKNPHFLFVFRRMHLTIPSKGDTPGMSSHITWWLMPQK